LVSDYVSRYEPIFQASKRAAESLTELIPGVGIARLGEDKVDKTLVCTEGYQKFPIVVLQFASAQNGEPVTMVGYNRKDLNLVQIFDLPSGAAFRG